MRTLGKGEVVSSILTSSTMMHEDGPQIGQLDATNGDAMPANACLPHGDSATLIPYECERQLGP